MKILYYFRELNTPMYWWQKNHIFSELGKHGIKIVTFNPLDFHSVADANQNLLSYISKTRDIDVFLTCVDSDWIYRSTIELINKVGIPTILVCWDNLELPYKHKAIAPAFDLVWVTSFETKYLFEKWGCKKIVFQTYAANPYAFFPRWNDVLFTVGFIGSPYGSRINKINDLIQNEISCSVYSNSLFDADYNTSQSGGTKFDFSDILIKTSRYLRFPIGRKVLYSTLLNKFVVDSKIQVESSFLQRYRSVSDNEMISLYSNFALSLNITELRDTYILKTPIHKIHLRTFEIPMSGGLQFASYSDELATYFEEDKEIVMYRSKEEMLEKAKFYLDPSNASIAMKMKKAARLNAENNHTWKNRFDVVLLALK